MQAEGTSPSSSRRQHTAHGRSEMRWERVGKGTWRACGCQFVGRWKTLACAARRANSQELHRSREQKKTSAPRAKHFAFAKTLAPSVFVLLALLFCWFCLCGGPLSCHGCSNPSSWCGFSQARPSCRRVLLVWPKLWRRITQGSRAGVCVQSCRPRLLTPRVPVQIHQKSCKALWVKRENLKPRVRGVCMVWAATHAPFTFH